MKIDCFPFFNEVPLLQARLEWLYNYVDLFLVVEMDQTHSGHPKPFILDQVNLPEKVQRVKVRSPFIGKADPWQRERFQRNILTEFIPSGSHLIHHSDVDEFPHPSVFHLTPSQPLHLQQELYYYNLCNRVDHFWNLPFITPQLIQPSWMRHEPFPTIEAAGWHLSWFGSPQQRQEKIHSFAHQELNQPEALERILKASPQDPWSRQEHSWTILPRPTIPHRLWDCLSRHFEKKELVGD